MSNQLDEQTGLKQLDPGNMLGCVEAFGDQCAEAVQNARQQSATVASLAAAAQSMHHVVICGMGGSAIGGDLLRAYAQSQCGCPIEVVRNYALPHYVNHNTLCVVSSYSGNTEESLAALQDAQSKHAHIIVVSTGGQLLQTAQAEQLPYLTFPAGLQPRAALGYSFLTLLVLFESLGLLPDQRIAIEQLEQTLQAILLQNQQTVPTEKNPAKQLAVRLQGKLPVIYGGQDAFEPVARRWQGQLNENAKCLAHHNVLPEMNHNEILGWANPATLTQQCHAVFLADQGYHAKTLRRMEITQQILQDAGHSVSTITATGEGLLARMFSLIYFADFVSVYLAFLYQQDPTPIPAIDLLKQKLK